MGVYSRRVTRGVGDTIVVYVVLVNTWVATRSGLPSTVTFREFGKLTRTIREIPMIAGTLVDIWKTIVTEGSGRGTFHAPAPPSFLSIVTPAALGIFLTAFTSRH